MPEQQIRNEQMPPPSPGLILNQLINPGHEVWERGPGPFVGHQALAADRWRLVLEGGAALSVTRGDAEADQGSGYCSSCAYTHAAGGRAAYAQKLEDLAQLRGRSAAFSIRVKTTTPGAVRPVITADGGVTRVYGPFHAGTGEYQTLEVSAALPLGATSVVVGVEFVASCLAHVDSAVCAAATVAPLYTPVHPTDDLARCKRFYERYAGVPGGAFVVRGTLQGGLNAIGMTVLFATRKAATPTVTRNGTWAVQSCSQPFPQSTRPDGFELTATGTAGAQASFYADSADDTLVAEVNL